ncbi:MAG: hypothetical protein WC440_00460 [Candidatus Omnitrophota bacterium]
MSIPVYPRYALACERAPMTSTTLIVFSPSKRGFLRFDGHSWRESARMMLASRGDMCDYQEVIRGNDWHRLVLDIDLSQDSDRRDEVDANAAAASSSSSSRPRMSVDEFRACLEEIIKYAIDVFLFMFHSIISRADFIVCESLDEREPDRFGAHITIARMVNSNKVAARFTDALICAVPDRMRALIDRSINSTQHNLRVIGCVKPGSVRVKKVSASNCLQDETNALVCAIAQHLVCDDECCEDANVKQSIDVTSPSCLPKYIARACQLIDAKYGAGVHTLRDCANGAIISFDRKKPSYCDICMRTHEHDNTVVVIVTQNDAYDETSCTYREICRHGQSGASITLEGAHHCDYVELALKQQASFEHTCAKISSLAQKCSKLDVYEDSVMHPYPMARTVFVQAPMKLGKTKMLRKFVNDLEQSNDDLRVIILSFRRTFTRSIATAFPEFVPYTEATGTLAFTKMIVQVESLHRIEPEQFGGSIDLLIMDESESIISQFDSGLSKSRALDFAVFSWLIKNSQICLALDAYMTNRTYGVIGRMRGWNDSVHVHNTYKNARDDTWHFTQNVDLWLTVLMKCIDKNEHIVICANSLMEGKTINDMVMRRYELLPKNVRRPIIKFYSSETPVSVKVRDFREVDQCWTQCDILIYTPTLTAGVSFEREHFDSLFGYFTDRSCDAQTCIQMMGRVRNIATHRAFVCMNGSRGSFPTTREDIILCLRVRKHMLFDEFIDVEFDEAGLPTIPDTDYAELHMHNIIARNRSRNWFAYELIRMVAQTGAKIGELTMKVIQDMMIDGSHITNADILAISLEHTATQGAVKYAHAQAIANARDLSIEEYERLRIQLSTPGVDANDDDRNAVSKFALGTTYRISADMIDVDFVMEYDDLSVICAFRNLSDICHVMRASSGSDYIATAQTMTRALDTMREHERACMRVIAPSDAEAIEEMNFAHTYETHRIPYVILVGIGFDGGIFDRRVFERDDVNSRADAFGRTKHVNLWQSALYHFKIKRRRTTRGGRASSFPTNGQEVINWLRQILISAYLMNIVLVGDTSYRLCHSDSFTISPDFDISPSHI